MENKMISISDLRKVSGIGNKTIERIKELLDSMSEDEQYISKYDESIHLGRNAIHNGDCLELMNGIPDKSVDMILCDLPYGTTQCSWDSVIELDKLWLQYNRVIKDNGAIVLTSDEPFTSTLIQSNLGTFKYKWVWDKVRGVGHLNAKKMPMKATEDVCVFYKTPCTYNPQMRDRDKPRLSMNNATQEVYGSSEDNFVGEVLDKKYPINLITFSKSNQRDFTLHPTQKPVALFEYLIKTYTNEGDLVVDNTMGSGTTCVACINTNRDYIGIEMDKEYFEIAKDRINHHK